MILHRKVNFD